MFTNREEVLERAFKVFLKLNYERASISVIASTCGLSRAGVIYYFPHKLDLFVGVADKYLFHTHSPEHKFGNTDGCTLDEFIGRYAEGVRATMRQLTAMVEEAGDRGDACPHFYYYHFINQVRMYYPGAREKVQEFFRRECCLWEAVVGRAVRNGELREGVDVGRVAGLFCHVFYGMGFEQSFLDGLDVDELERNLREIYSFVKR